MKIWFPVIKTNSGSDAYSVRMVDALVKYGIDAEITWFDSRYEFMPRLLKKKSPPSGTTIIHANSWNAFAFKRLSIPLVITEHHCVLDPQLSKYKSIIQKMYHSSLIKKYEITSFGCASAVVAVSNYTALAMQRAGFDIDATVIHNWVDVDIFSPGEDERTNESLVFDLLFVGSWTRRKGTDILKSIMSELGHGFRLSIVSNTPIPRSEMLPNMVNLGALDMAALIDTYRSSDAVLFPTRFEGFGYVAVEAMACAKPVIVSDSTALPEVVGDAGILCSVEDISSFVKACRKLSGDKALLDELGLKARKRVIKSFSEENSIKKYIQLYESLV